jgi:hypothetical protein
LRRSLAENSNRKQVRVIGHLPITYLSFEEIDTVKAGWITFDQFMAFTNQRVQKLADDVLKQGDTF